MIFIKLFELFQLILVNIFLLVFLLYQNNNKEDPHIHDIFVHNIFDMLFIFPHITQQGIPISFIHTK